MRRAVKLSGPDKSRQTILEEADIKIANCKIMWCAGLLGLSILFGIAKPTLAAPRDRNDRRDVKEARKDVREERRESRQGNQPNWHYRPGNGNNGYGNRPAYNNRSSDGNGHTYNAGQGWKGTVARVRSDQSFDVTIIRCHHHSMSPSAVARSMLTPFRTRHAA